MTTDANEPHATKVARRAAIAWIVEECAEYLSASDVPGELDAVYDALGIVLMMLCSYDRRDRSRAYDAYVEAQTTRNRSMNTPHQVLIRGIVQTASAFIGEDAEAMRHLRSRAARRERLTAAALDVITTALPTIEKTKQEDKRDEAATR